MSRRESIFPIIILASGAMLPVADRLIGIERIIGGKG